MFGSGNSLLGIRELKLSFSNSRFRPEKPPKPSDVEADEANDEEDPAALPKVSLSGSRRPDDSFTYYRRVGL